MREATIDKGKAMQMWSSYVLHKQIVAPGFIDYMLWPLTRQYRTNYAWAYSGDSGDYQCTQSYHQNEQTILSKIQYLVPILNPLKEKYKVN